MKRIRSHNHNIICNLILLINFKNIRRIRSSNQIRIWTKNLERSNLNRKKRLFRKGLFSQKVCSIVVLKQIIDEN